MEKSDFRETLTKEAMITSLPVYTIAFKTEPLHYICCYATLTNDFGEDLEKNAMIINERTGCCDEFAEERIFVSTHFKFYSISIKIFFLKLYSKI